MRNRIGKRMIARLHAHFPTSPLPIKVDGGGLDGNAAEKFFLSKAWPDISLSSLSNSVHLPTGSYPVSMTEESLAYYMPAYLRMLLKFSIEKTLKYYDTILYTLRLEDEGTTDLSRYCHKRFMNTFASSYTQEQKETVADILYHLQLKNYDQGMGLVKAAYDSYWYQYKSQPKQ